MAAIRLVEKIPSQFTMILADFHFHYLLLQGEGDSEDKKPEYAPHSHKVDVWHDCRISFFPRGDRSGYLEARPDGEIQIERGYVYKFEWVGEAPAPAPEPPAPPPPAEPPQQPQPAPAPIPPVPSVTMPKIITTAGYPEVTRPAAIWWGTSEYATMDLVWSVPEWWVEEALAAVKEKLIDRINNAIQKGEYTVEYRVRG